MKADDFFYMHLVERVAANKIYKQYGINRFELNMLAGLAAYLQLFDKRVVSRESYLKWLGIGNKTKFKCNGYIHGLVNHGTLHRLAWRQRVEGWSLAVTGFGVRVLESYYQEVSRLERQDSARLKHAGYKSLAVIDPPPGYKVEQLGRFE